ncbi:hypothetical protein NPIL_394061 [Nephila pilipes]|uniref:Uncharacterized protein n=1 Tax=Nephila pilipes TaxID=299642 RepID=A0A8X6QBW7_NEPPI|nr:hypothetical protein NPIL_394061 [Nephila pilipes]
MPHKGNTIVKNSRILLVSGKSFVPSKTNVLSFKQTSPTQADTLFFSLTPVIYPSLFCVVYIHGNTFSPFVFSECKLEDNVIHFSRQMVVTVIVFYVVPKTDVHSRKLHGSTERSGL